MKFRLGKPEAARGDTEKAMDLYKSAIVDYTQAIKSNADNNLAYDNRGLAKSALGDLESTRGDAEKAMDLYESAIVDHTQATQINPKYADAHSNRAIVEV